MRDPSGKMTLLEISQAIFAFEVLSAVSFAIIWPNKEKFTNTLIKMVERIPVVPGTNWCGPGPYLDKDGTPTTNCVDEGCKAHDQCFADCGSSAAIRLTTAFWDQELRDCLIKCDIDVIAKMQNVCGNGGCGEKGSFGEVIQAAMVLSFFTIYP